MVTKFSDSEGVNWPDVRNVPIQAEALNVLIANWSREATGEIVGSGQRAHNPEGAIQQKQANKEKEKDTRTKFNILMAQIRDRITELEAQLAELKAEMAPLRGRETTVESSLGGLDKMGQDLGASRLPDEEDETYRNRLKLIIDRKITAGEIDPASVLAQWSTNRDYIHFNLDQQAILSEDIHDLKQAAATENPQIMEQALDKSQVDERVINGEVDTETISSKEIRESSYLSVLSLTGVFGKAQDDTNPVQELAHNSEQSNEPAPGINPGKC
ncbi:MAG: hypothetical protein O7D86_02930 [Proteobacteria bacterium]|nr:hypothetical protein [Pseudomonadota bacterium]